MRADRSKTSGGPGFWPRTFALYQPPDDGESPDGEEVTVVAWGMTLPDGSAVVISAAEAGSRSMAVTSSPASAAWIYHADLAWTAAFG